MDHGGGVCVSDISERHKARPVTLITSLGVWLRAKSTNFIYLFLINPEQSRWQLRGEIVTFAISLSASLCHRNVATCIKSAAALWEAFVFSC